MGLFSFFGRKKYRPEEPRTTRLLYNVQGGQLVVPETSMKVSAFYSGVIYISTQIAKLPWEIKDDKNRKLSGPLSSIIGLSPNPEMNSFSLRLFLTQEALIKGNGYAEIERDVQGRVRGIWPIPAEYVYPTRVDGELVYRIAGGSLIDPGADTYLLPQDVFHIKNFYTFDGLMGQGLTHYAQHTLGIGLGSDLFAGSLFANGGLPSGVLEVDGNLSEEGAKRLKESWSSAHGGRKTGGTAVLEEGVKYSPISHDPQVLQFLESRKFTVLEIARFLRLPPTKLYDAETSSYNNVEHANLEVAVDTLDAWARNFEMEADIKLLNKGAGGRRTEMDLYAIFRGDMDTRSQYFSRMMQDAAMTPNEIRTKEGLAPYEGGDRYYIANNNFAPVDRMDELLDAQMKQKEMSKEESPKKEEEDDEVNEAVVNYLRSRS
jgi:HK97 family phage portal protein